MLHNFYKINKIIHIFVIYYKFIHTIKNKKGGKPMRKKFNPLIVIACMLLQLAATADVYASPEASLKKNQEKLEKINILLHKTNENENKILNLIKKNGSEIKKNRNVLIDTQKQYQNKKFSLEIKNDFYFSKLNDLSILNSFLQYDSPNEFFYQLELNKVLIKETNQVLNELDTLQEEALERGEELLEEREILVKEKNNVEKEKKVLVQKRKMFKKAVREDERCLKELYQKRNRSLSQDKGEQIVTYAKQFLGTPYVWGGTSPQGFDCSGLVYYVYQNTFGITLPRVARDQQLVGTQLIKNQIDIDEKDDKELKELRAGDLIFFGYPAHHVGIYIGNGKYIHAPHTGDFVKISNISWNSVSSATRIF